MPRHVALLRAINVGGHTVEMKRLQKLFEMLAFTDVETFIASGNVIFTAAAGPARALESRIEAHLERSLGYSVATFLRTPPQLRSIAEHRAFAKPAPGSTLYIGFLAAKPVAAAVRQMEALATDIDEFRVHDRELYWRCRKTMGVSKVSGAKLEKALGLPMTLRQLSTVEKLAAKYG